MKVLVIGGSGTIGKAVVNQLSTEHEVIVAGHSSGDVTVDLADSNSIRAMFERIGQVDAVISSAGVAQFSALEALSDELYQQALNNKLMGQINLLRIGREFIREGGSLTLTSGILSRYPMPGSAAVSMVNGALESFVKAAALELNGLRLNAVAPDFVKETMSLMGMDDSEGVSAADTAKVYARVVEGEMHGTVVDVNATTIGTD